MLAYLSCLRSSAIQEIQWILDRQGEVRWSQNPLWVFAICQYDYPIR